jgi:DNA-binding NarL/FixJ family response regulator
MFAEALCAYLEKTYTVVGIVPDGHTMVKEALSQRPDVIIVDVGMPRVNGLDAARRFFFTTASPLSYLKLRLHSAFEDSAVGGAEDAKVANYAPQRWVDVSDRLL